MNYIIFDLDGCVADDRRRRPLLARGYDEYHADMANDPVINGDVVASAFRSEGCRVAFLTARPAKWEHLARSWIVKSFQIPFFGAQDFDLIMRPDEDHRGSVALKTDAVKKLGVGNVRKLYDDREDVVQAVRALGIDAEVLTFSSAETVTKEKA